MSSSHNKPLACPICGEVAFSLSLLNQHLDELHSATTEEHQRARRNWLRAGRKVIAPVFSVANKLASQFTNSTAAPQETESETDSEAPNVTREHWQPDGPNDICAEDYCGKPLTRTLRRHHCRRLVGHVFPRYSAHIF